MELIINADDFGVSKSTNRAILQFFKENLISSATIMINMPGFQEACEMIRNQSLHFKIGIHLNLTKVHSGFNSGGQLMEFVYGGETPFLSPKNNIFVSGVGLSTY